MPFISGKSNIFIIYLYIGILFFPLSCEDNSVTNSLRLDKPGYPRLAMWWPDTREQPVEELARYDWIGFGAWDDISTIKELKAVNPDQKQFMDYSITETSWSSWEDNKISIEPRDGRILLRK